jgi:hypothetical protein
VEIEFFELPFPTSQTVTGPKLSLDSEVLVVAYDFEHDDGTVTWTKVSFQQVLVFEYREMPCIRVEDLDAHNRIVAYSHSAWSGIMESRWREFLGQRAGDVFPYSHLRMYFDDVASIDILAQSFTVVVKDGEPAS